MDVIPFPEEEIEYSADNKLPSQTKSLDGERERQPQLCDVWRDVQGANNWKDFLNPIHPILKSEALRYGDLAQLCYDAFDGESYSRYYGTCKHREGDLFEKMGMSGCGYQVTKYIYANTDLLSELFGEKQKDNGVWLGFVAVCTDPNEIRRLGRRDIVIAWRGTQTTQEWIQNVRDVLVPTRLSYRIGRTGKVHKNEGVRIERGFLSCYTSTIGQHEDSTGRAVDISTRNLVLGEIERLLQVYQNDKLSITFTGHSLGAALATLSAYDVKQMLISALSHDIAVTVFAFASPRVGNLAFAQQVEETGVKVLRFVNKRDVVPKVPGVLMNENLGFLSKFLQWLPWTYFHVGVEVSLGNNSPLLKVSHNLAYVHNLEGYLHLLDGFVGDNRPYNSCGRDPALVNKSSDLLIEELGIPPKWWQEQNKGLIKDSDGKWKQPTKSVDEDDKEEK